MKKSIIALIAAASLVRIICLAMFGVYLYIQWFHYTFIVNANYVEYSESNDDFVLKTKEVVYDDGLRAVTFYVEDADGKRVYECGRGLFKPKPHNRFFAFAKLLNKAGKIAV